MAVYCDWSDLPEEACAHCRDGGDQTALQQTRRTTSSGTAPFRATFTTVCQGCDWEIEPGMWAVYRDGMPVHRGSCDT